MNLDIILKFLIPTGIILGSFFVGMVVEKIILKRLAKIAERTKWRGDEIIIASLQRNVILWFVIAGLYISISMIAMPPNIYHIVYKILLCLLILSVTIFSVKLLSGFLRIWVSREGEILPSTTIITTLTNIIIYAIGVLIILQTLDISITPIITTLGVGGIAIALALQRTLANLFSGVQILASRQVNPGDYVKLDSGDEGYVEDINWRSTSIKTLGNNIIAVPNTKLADAIVINHNFPKTEMSVLVEVGVAYESNLENVERVTLEVAKETMREIPGGVSEFKPFIRYHTFGDFSINFTVILRVKKFVDKYLMKHEFIKRLHKRYKKENIEIPFPIRTVYTKNPAS